ncbi:AbrB family transcriptional regulator [Amylibacter sp. IMCC11727]|uniref:AbrB family transcriptional regulator n=1 Tax=Amylibacter sp. IMCC11727 TaxID=3039851 RepID=UPI00244DB06E|nr:AbrB family transcriptional regulator [Amylibacter sp. IMCC11727]WGI23319.1 AbrB family transcriptional regulator [Amylibacter sp. IMCC11727]
MARYHLATFVIGLVGALVFLFVNAPLPWLFGPMVSCLIAALLGVQLRAVKPLNEAMRTILGVAVGATVTVAFLQDIVGLWSTLILVPMMVFLIGLIGVPYFQRLWGYDWATSYYAAMPGGLQDMLTFGEEAGGNVRAMSLIHATRVLVIIIALPVLLRVVWQADLSKPPGAAAGSIPIDQVGIMIVCGLVGWQVAKRVGMFGASILGPLVLTAMAALSGVLDHRPPAEAVWMAQFFIAITIGVKYVNITGAEIRKDVLAGLGFCVILIILTLIFVEFVHYFDLAPPMESVLALAPGGQAELVVLALIVGADMTFVVAHHLLRIFVVILGAPIFSRLFKPHQTD